MGKHCSDDITADQLDDIREFDYQFGSFIDPGIELGIDSVILPIDW